jgi:hypothetical protein
MITLDFVPFLEEPNCGWYPPTRLGPTDFPRIQEAGTVRQEAYRIYCERQRQGKAGGELDDWLEAEKAIRAGSAVHH